MSQPPQFEAPSPEELHELLPAYDVLAFIAKGGMGAVYKAHQKSLERDVAIKILPREFGADEDFRKRFADEAKAMARLNHPNLIAVYDFGEVDGMPYIVMELVDGKSLHHSAHGKAIEQKEAIRLVHGICDGLAHAHEAGILHRDVKPANILLDSKKRPKIGDFGLARAADETEGDGMAFGTPDYTAPEVLQDPDAVDKRADVYAIGVILYELLTGKPPESNYVPASQVEDVDPRFDKIVRRATHPSRTLRYADAGAMAKDVAELESYLDKPIATIVTKATATNLTAKESHEPSPAGTSAAASTPAAPPQVHVATGPNWSLLRNLIIIGVLLVAIFGMYKAYQWKKADIEAKQAEEDRKQQEEKQRRADEAFRQARERAASMQDKPSTKPTPSVTETPEPEPETPLEELARLRRQLSNGDRIVFPTGTLVRGSNRFFLVETPMSWQRAAAFAETHGGHLATCLNEGEKNWLSSKIPRKTSVWLGGGAIGRSSWGWVDGTEWTVREPSISTGTCASLSDLGTIRAKPGGENFPFFIQWRMDGENPGSLTAQLERLIESLDSPDPVFPPGVLAFESRRYLIVEKNVTWHEASTIATEAHGHLAVPSEPTEGDYMKTAVNAALPDGGGAWIGGKHNGRAWTWITGEAWSFANWAPDQPAENESQNSVVRILGGADGGWASASPEDSDAGAAFVIEWSKDRATTREVAVPTGGADWAALRAAALKRVNEIEAGFAKRLQENGKNMKWDLNFWHRGLRDSVERQFAPAVIRMKAQVQPDGSIKIPDNERIELPPRAVQIVRDYVDKEKALHELREQELEKARKKYVIGLEEKKAEAQSKGLNSKVRSIENEIAGSGEDGDSFHQHLLGTR